MSSCFFGYFGKDITAKNSVPFDTDQFRGVLVMQSSGRGYGVNRAHQAWIKRPDDMIDLDRIIQLFDLGP